MVSIAEMAFDLERMSGDVRLESAKELLARGAMLHLGGGAPPLGLELRRENLLGGARLGSCIQQGADLNSHSGVTRAVEQALNRAGVRKVHTLVVPCAPEQWAGEPETSLATLAEVSLFSEVLLEVGGLPAAHAALALSAVGGVRLGAGTCAGDPDETGKLLAAAGALGKTVEVYDCLALAPDARARAAALGARLVAVPVGDLKESLAALAI